MDDARPDMAAVLASLKPFQRLSADYVFRRLYGAGATRRFLLADEVGLGKTVVAKGIIAMVVNHLWSRPGPISIVYICSNQDVARQNIVRLSAAGDSSFAHATRITLLPIAGNQSGRDRVRFVSFTPGTSFDLKSSLGRSDERVLLYHLLKNEWAFRGAPPRNVLQGDCKAESFLWQLDHFKESTIDQSMEQGFLTQLKTKPELRATFENLCGDFHRADANIEDDVWDRRAQLVGDLRATLARSCLESLKPDLVILDEFQRFKHLLSDEEQTEAARLARDLFEYSGEHSAARVLMLSATPYKMYTAGYETDDDHYSDFLHTARFLFDDPARTDGLKKLIENYGDRMRRLNATDDPIQLAAVRDELVATLLKIMCRTERLAVTADRGGMLKEISSAPELRTGDLGTYLAVQKIARAVGHPDTIEYWKSSPYLLSFMDEYVLKNHVADSTDPEVVAAVENAIAKPGGLVPWDVLRSFNPIDSNHPRLRQLIAEVVDGGAWEALWVPPAVPYYKLKGPVAEMAARSFTKRLVFSCWKMVPKAIATLISYEADRRVMSRFDPQAVNTAGGRRVSPLLNFSRSQGRLAGMPVLGLLYPSSYLAREFDPLRYMCEQPAGNPLSAREVVGLIQFRMEEAIQPLLKGAALSGPVDESWYWAAPMLLDLQHDPAGSQGWWGHDNLETYWADGDDDDDDRAEGSEEDEATGWESHVAFARQLIHDGVGGLGRPPGDLAKVLAQLAVAGPAVTALRAIARVSGGLDQTTNLGHRFAAGRVAFGMRSLFNAPDVIALIRGRDRSEPYWRRVVDYCLAGCIQAVLDEYAHVLRGDLGETPDPIELVRTIGRSLATALNLRVANLDASRITVENAKVNFSPEKLRTAFALRYGNNPSDTGYGSRAADVQTAFNSPFRPFVLATTSVGQEGLDFHPYCHAVVHWNLPSNPVDLEQREGRVHRYKGHAVRKNVAKAHARSLGHDACLDPWTRLFELAAEQSEDKSGLSPYWVYPVEGGAHIERHVPALPLSREESQLPALRNSLAVYRMVFGQPRQDDLIEFLSRRLGPDALASRIDSLRIDLTPPG
jgi:hypothetical protein